MAISGGLLLNLPFGLIFAATVLLQGGNGAACSGSRGSSTRAAHDGHLHVRLALCHLLHWTGFTSFSPSPCHDSSHLPHPPFNLLLLLLRLLLLLLIWDPLALSCFSCWSSLGNRDNYLHSSSLPRSSTSGTRSGVSGGPWSAPRLSWCLGTSSTPSHRTSGMASSFCPPPPANTHNLNT